MELWVKIPGEDMDWFAFLNSEGLHTQLIKGYVIGKFDYPESVEYNIADFPEDAEFYFVFWEYGGSATNTGVGVIVCDNRGEPFTPTEIYTTGHLANKIHAEFQEKCGHIIECTKHGQCWIFWVQADRIHDSISVSNKPVWHGNVKDLPNKYKYLRKAVNAAWKKANIYHCRKAVYIKEG